MPNNNSDKLIAKRDCDRVVRQAKEHLLEFPKGGSILRHPKFLSEFESLVSKFEKTIQNSALPKVPFIEQQISLLNQNIKDNIEWEGSGSPSAFFFNCGVDFAEYGEPITLWNFIYLENGFLKIVKNKDFQSFQERVMGKFEIIEKTNLTEYEYNDFKNFVKIRYAYDHFNSFVSGYNTIKLRTYIEQKLQNDRVTEKDNDMKKTDNEPNDQQPNKLKWLGTPSQFGFIIDLLIQGGYLEKPTRSFNKDTLIYLSHFDIETTIQTLAKEISENGNSIRTPNRKKFKIPHKDQV